MPVYTFECQHCEYLFEEYQKISDKPLKKCPQCKKNKLLKIISLTARPVVPGDVQDEYMKVKREAKQIAQKIIAGDEKAIADVYGDDVASGKARKEATKPKTLDQVKGGKIKRSTSK